MTPEHKILLRTARNSINCIVINLAKDKARYAILADRLEQLEVDFSRLDAVDGRGLTDDERANFKSQRPRNRNGWWSDGQIGCFLSHSRAWEIAARSPHNFTCIMEDDVHLSDAVTEFLSDDGWIPPGIDLVRLEASNVRVRLDRAPLAAHAGRQVHKIRSTTWGTAAYIISRQAARKALDMPPESHNAVDYFMFSFEEAALSRAISAAQVTPAVCVQDQFQPASRAMGFATSIEPTDTSFIAKLQSLSRPRDALRAASLIARGSRHIRFKA